MIPRATLLLLIPSFVGCVSVDRERRGPEHILSTHCEPGRTTASLDPASKDSVRLLFDRAESCSTDSEVVWATDTDRRLAVPVRVTLGVLAGLAVGLPLVGALVLATPASANPSGNRAIDEVVGPLIVGVSLGVGGGTFVAAGGTINSSTVERVEVVRGAGVPSESPVLKGTFAINGVPHVLRRGTVDLSLADALLLEKGPLTLDGAPVDLALRPGQRVTALTDCYEALLPSMDAGARLSHALLCKRMGWSFANGALAELAGSSTP